MMQLAFILYDNRSGSTLLSALLNRYQAVSVSQETDVVFRVLEYQLREQLDEVSAENLIDHLYTSTRFPELKIKRNALPPYPKSKQQLLTAITTTYFSQKDPLATWWVIKAPRTYYHIATLLSYYPNAKFIQIVRDGRAVLSSKERTLSVGLKQTSNRDRSMSQNFLHTAAVWRNKLRIADKYAEHIHTVRYEDLLDRPNQTLTALLDDLNVPPDNREITKTQAQYSDALHKPYHAIHRNVGESIRTELAEKWQTTLSPIQIYLYERANHHLLTQHNYVLREFGSPHPMTFYMQAGITYLAYTLHRFRVKVQELARYRSNGRALFKKVGTKFLERFS